MRSIAIAVLFVSTTLGATIALAGPYTDQVRPPVSSRDPSVLIRRPPGEPYGAIGEKWRQLGGATGMMGKALIDEADAANGGRYVEFEWGYIFWRGDLGAHNVLYPLSRKWVGMGRERGFGYPVTDTIFSVRNGKCVDFEHGGTICWEQSKGRSSAVYGAIRARWVQLGRETGACGYPLSDEFDWRGMRRSTFERGFITWSANAGVVVHGCPGFQGDVELNPVPN